MMNNPHLKDNWYLHYLDEEVFYNRTIWHDVGMWVEAGGLALVICTININTGSHANVGFRLVDENNEPLAPFRTSTNTRIPTHFTAEPNYNTDEDHTHVSFHMVVNCKYVKLQFRPSDGNFRVNMGPGTKNDRPWNHKTISTMTAIPLLPHYQGGANTIFTYPQSRMARMSEKDKPKPRSGHTKPAGPSDS